MSSANLRQKAYNCLLELSTPEGILASSKDEVFGCIFGRDSAVTILKILHAHCKKPSLELLEVCRRALLTLINLQGKKTNIESGEELGKFIHEYRPQKYEHLLTLDKPWYIYPEGVLKNYDSIDATPLTLIALYKYWQITSDDQFLVTALPAIEAGLNWIITFGDLDKDTLIEYELPVSRKHGGLVVQSWTDSHESLRQFDGSMPKYPIAPVEAQGYAWLALKLWADYYAETHPEFSQRLSSQAEKLKSEFNKKFIFKDQNFSYAAQALDGDKVKIKTITGNPLLLFWASYIRETKVECILDESLVIDFVKRGFMNDLFDAEAGIRTMSTTSLTFNPNTDSYHNGSFWPVLNGLIYEGLEVWGFAAEAERLKQATLLPLFFFGCPIELYIKNDQGFFEYQSPSGQVSCKTQAWSAATALDLLTV